MPRIIESSFNKAADAHKFTGHDKVYVGFWVKNSALQDWDLAEAAGLSKADFPDGILTGTTGITISSDEKSASHQTLRHFCYMVVSGQQIHKIQASHDKDRLIISGFKPCVTGMEPFEEDFLPYGVTAKKDTGWDKFRNMLGI